MRAFRGSDAIKPRSDGRLRGAGSNREVLLGERNRVAQMNRLIRVRWPYPSSTVPLRRRELMGMLA